MPRVMAVYSHSRVASGVFSTITITITTSDELGLGILLVFCLNQMRLLLLFYVYRSEPSLFNLLHGTVTPIIFVLCVALYALYWMGDSQETVQPNAPENP